MKDYHQWLAATAYIFVALCFPQYTWANDWAMWADAVGVGKIDGFPPFGGI